MIDRLVQATIEVDEGVGSPQAACQFLACDELARLLQQRQQDVEGLIAKRSSTAAPSELARTNVDSKCPEMIDPRGLDAIRHRPNPGECARVYHPAENTISRHLTTMDEPMRSEEHTSELQSLRHLVCRLLLEKKKKKKTIK